MFTHQSTGRLMSTEDVFDHISKSFLVVPWITGIIFSCFFIIQAILYFPGYVCFCHFNLILNKIVYLVTLAILLLFEISIALAFYHCLKLSRVRLADFNINSISHSLSDRFNIQETIRITQMLFPSAVIHGSCWLALLVFEVAVLLDTNDDDRKGVLRNGSSTDNSNALMLLCPLLAASHSLIHPIIIFSKSNHLRKALFGEKINRKHCSTVTVMNSGAGGVGVNHKKILEDIWAQKRF